jgi:tetratricopeptide (TPR) repeat protein
MGEVWGGRHLQGVPVAVKVLTARRGDDPRVREALRNEVRAVARLHHPNIILLLDHGVVDDAAAEASIVGSERRLTAGSPYLAMELVSGGTLEEHRPRDWPTMRQLLLEILDGLGHAHARGVVHRDLKPSNVLCAAPGDVRGGIRLSDFGIAHAFDRGERERDRDGGRPISGTPGYMAPEQITGSPRDEGPWTDLYALGIIAYQLMTGAMPFGATTGVELLDKHLTAPVPQPVARFAVPRELDAWIMRLLAKRPCNRFERAADAAWALRGLPAEVVGPADGGDLPPLADAPTGTLTTAHVMAPGWNLAEEATEAAVVGAGDRAGAPPWQLEPVQPPLPAPPLPASWRLPDDAPPVRLLGAGLGLYGVRPVPMVGRAGERDALWRALRAVSEDRTTQVVVVRGAAGHGKSRIVEWIAQRADEVGGATVLRASHGPIAGAHDGLPGMAAALLQVAGLGRDAAALRCRRFLVEHVALPLEADEHLALVELALGDDGGRGGQRLATAADRYFVVRRLIERLAPQRPVLAWLDDAQWGADAIGFAGFALDADRGAPLPLLLVLTVREESVGERPLEAELLRELESRPGVTRVDLGALPAADHAALVERLLGLSGPLVDEVVRRTDGNPLFAVQLVGDWVQRGALVAGVAGFELAPGEAAPLPDDIHALWTGRVDRTLAAFPTDAGLALERAAALGPDVAGDEWAAACAVSGLVIAPGLVDALLTHRLAAGTDQAWTFAHAMLRESLDRRAVEAGRYPAHHRACADALDVRNPDSAAVAERIARHRLAAGDREAALGPLLVAADRLRRTNDLRQAAALYEAHADALTALGKDEADPRWGESLTGLARVTLGQGKASAARALLDRGEAIAERTGQRGLLARILTIRARLAFEQGDAETSYKDGQRALAAFAGVDDPHGLADCLIGLGATCMWRWLLDEALGHYRAAYQLAYRTGDRLQQGATLRGMGNVRACVKDLAGSEELLVRAQAIFQEGGNRGPHALCLNDLGEVARHRGDLVRAEALYRQSLTLAEALAAPEASTPRFNLGLVLLEKGRFTEARRHFTALLATLGERTLDLVWTNLALAACAGAEADWDAWERLVAASEDGLAGGLVDEDLARLATRAAELTRDAGEGARARRLYAMAAGLWDRLGQHERRDTCRRAHDALAAAGG